MVESSLTAGTPAYTARVHVKTQLTNDTVPSKIQPHTMSLTKALIVAYKQHNVGAYLLKMRLGQSCCVNMCGSRQSAGGDCDCACFSPTLETQRTYC